MIPIILASSFPWRKIRDIFPDSMLDAKDKKKKEGQPNSDVTNQFTVKCAFDEATGLNPKLPLCEEESGKVAGEERKTAGH